MVRWDRRVHCRSIKTRHSFSNFSAKVCKTVDVDVISLQQLLVQLVPSVSDLSRKKYVKVYNLPLLISHRALACHLCPLATKYRHISNRHTP